MAIPDRDYATTRHNLGFLVADILADRIGSGFKVHKKSGAEVTTGRLGGRSVVLAKPRVYMNESGRQVGPLANFYSVAPADVIVLHDELDIDFGRIRLKFGGGVAGHNGLRSVSSALGTNDFQRVRIGIGRPPGRKSGATFVLENFTAAERPEVADDLRAGRRRDRTADRARARTRPEHRARLGLTPPFPASALSAGDTPRDRHFARLADRERALTAARLMPLSTTLTGLCGYRFSACSLASEFGQHVERLPLLLQRLETRSMNPLRSSRYGSMTSSPAGHTARQ